jgi:hypothetical protein
MIPSACFDSVRPMLTSGNLGFIGKNTHILARSFSLIFALSARPSCCAATPCPGASSTDPSRTSSDTPRSMRHPYATASVRPAVRDSFRPSVRPSVRLDSSLHSSHPLRRPALHHDSHVLDIHSHEFMRSIPFDHRITRWNPRTLSHFSVQQTLAHIACFNYARKSSSTHTPHFRANFGDNLWVIYT